MARLGRISAMACGALGVGLTMIYGLQLDARVNSLCVIAVAVVACVAALLGPRLHRPRAHWPWRLLAAAAIAFLCGMLIRPWSAMQHGFGAYSADAFTLPGFAMLIVSLVLMLRSGGRLGRHAVADGIIICLGAALISIVFFALPAAEIQTRPKPISIIAGLYPIFDVVMLLLLLNLGFSTAVRLVSFRSFAFGMCCLFIGDTGYSWIGAQGKLVGSPLLDLPYLLAYTSIAVAALDPSMTGLSSVAPRQVQAWSKLRFSLIVPALLSPCVLAALPSPSPAERVVALIVTVGLMAAVLARSISAVRGYTRVQQMLREQITHDTLTGLPNRTALNEHLQTLLSQTPDGGQLCLLNLDLDEFRLVNDHWGHEIGDQLLCEVARRLQGLADSRYFVARIGGDEFVLTGQAVDGGGLLVGAIQQALGEPIQLPGLDLIITCSIGIAANGDNPSAEAMLRDADTALYQAKAEGRNRGVVFEASMRATLGARVETEAALRYAITHGQLWVAYQPMVDPTTEQTIGAEALIRWTHPDRGSISPAEFIPVAEETGLIKQIGTWVMEESLQQVARWRDDGVLPEKFSMSVNVSARQVHDPGLHQRISEALARHQISPNRLTVEITESVLMADTQTATEVLTGLRSAGFGLSVDDFGTGYSSLGYLSRFPVTEVKIDRSFVAGLGSDPGADAIVRAVVAMAAALGLEVVAEGVETPQQRSVLCDLQIHRAQGWLWGAATDGAQFAARHLDDPSRVPGGSLC